MSCPYCSGEQAVVALNKHYDAKLTALRDQIEAWREVAGMLAASLQAGAASVHPSAYHFRGTALESYERLKTNGTTSDL